MLIRIIGKLIPSQKQLKHCEEIKYRNAKMPVSLLITGLIASLCISSGISHAANIYVTKAGVPDPNGSVDKPYHVVESAIDRVRELPGSAVLIEPGKYYETVTIDTPCTLKNTGGPVNVVTIGKMDYQASTTLDIITLNTHLYGDCVGPKWKDCERANDIANFIKAMVPKPDVVAFQEIWDNEFFKGGDCNGEFEILTESGYEYGRHGKMVSLCPSWPCALNSGLALMSKYPLDDYKQKGYADCQGFFECRAAKGWIRATIEIENSGFSVGLFNTHTQSGPAGYWWVRFGQVSQLGAAILDYREAHRDHAVFVMGDFNIYDSEEDDIDLAWEYSHILIRHIGVDSGGRDADRNSPGFTFGSLYQDTCSRANPLALQWDSDTVSGRLDYIFYFPSMDGSVEVIPMDVDVVYFTGRDIPACVSGPVMDCRDWQVTNESSDHRAVHGKFILIRK